MPGTQPERDVNREGRKRAEKGQKIAGGTNRVRNFSLNIRVLGWLAKTIWDPTFSASQAVEFIEYSYFRGLLRGELSPPSRHATPL
jgi:hypothetical protein